ncbi:MAG: hypothetical protein KJ571_12655 [Bacteroidetes bacterium]|nr:hypothetical protein [Bacteroidota bacterium]
MDIRENIGGKNSNSESILFFVEHEVPVFISKFENIINEISSVAGNSENEFLEIGGKLQNYLSTSRELLDVSQKAGSSISNEILEEGIAKLSTLLESFSDKFSNSALEIKYKKENLQNIYKQMEAIINELFGFNKIVKRLKMLGISTKIESARLGTDDNGFYLLAEKVDELSGTISDKAAAIHNKANHLKTEINKTIIDLSGLEIEQTNQSKIILNNTTHSLQIFKNKYSDCISKIDNNISSYTGVSKNISKIVTSIQFHDITRQQMEHVSESTAEIKNGLLEIDCNTGQDEAVDKLRTVSNICGLQIEQIKNSLNEFESAVANIKTSLENVENNINDILVETEELLSDSKHSGENILKNVQVELETVSGGLIKSTKIGDELTLSIKSVVTIVNELAAQVREIEEIGSELEIIALNARVKAARTGDNGMALGVIAESIQNLSLEAKSQTVSTIDVFKSIETTSIKLSGHSLQNAESDNADSIFATNKEISELVNLIIKQEEDAGKLIETLHKGVDKLNNDINETRANLDVHNEFKFSIERIKEDFENISGLIDNSIGVDPNKSRNIQALMKNYTMNSERRIHNNFAEDKNLRLEDNSNDNSIDSCNDLGDNIELF